MESRTSIDDILDAVEVAETEMNVSGSFTLAVLGFLSMLETVDPAFTSVKVILEEAI